MTKYEREVLLRFAEQDWPRSSYELFGQLAYPANATLDAAIAALRQAGLLVALPTEEQRDRHGGTVFKASSAGRVALGLATTIPAKAAKGKVSNGRTSRRASA